MSRNTPPAQPVTIPDTITIVSGSFICQATSQPAIVNTTSPMASSTRNENEIARRQSPHRNPWSLELELELTSRVPS
jgi:hypothetical protein